jgi:hypothetical protein
MIRYEKVNESLPTLLTELLNQPKYPLATLTKGKIETILNTKTPTAGVYLFSEIETDTPVYIGRSKTLAQRIGTDHRAIQKAQATLGLRLWKHGIDGVLCMNTAREYMYMRFNVRILTVEDVYVRTIFEVYAAMNLDTIYNSFLEH